VRVLAGDIGGTKTSLGIVEIGADRLSLIRHERFASRDYPTLESVLREFLRRGSGAFAAAAFGVAGPVREGRAFVTKLPWRIQEKHLARLLKLPGRVRLVNDFVAAALGLSYLPPESLAVLARGRPEPRGPIGLIGAGTGLGEAALVPFGGRYEPAASEGGHADFGPRSRREDALLRFVRARCGRVSRDRLLSGEGLRLIYDFLRSEGRQRERAVVRRALRQEDPAAVISRFGLAKKDPLCADALATFVSIYGSEAGNLALQYKATGGVFVAGGIAPKILPALRRGGFLQAFRSKPPLEATLRRIPVRVVLEPELGLYGAAAAAYRTAIEVRRPSAKRRIRRAPL
jgi:glucokinase